MIKMYSKYIVGVFLAALVLSGCEREYQAIDNIDETNIQNYLKANNLNMSKYTYDDTSSFYYQVVSPGQGEPVKYSDIVPVHYTLRTLDGSFISTDTFAVSQRYGASKQYLGYFGRQKGYPDPLRIGVVELLKNRGGKIRLVIPSKLAYGRNGRSVIPGNASLDYTVTVLNEPGIPVYDDISIQKYLQAQNLSGFTKTSSGIYYKILNPGTGSPITLDSTLTIESTGRFFNGSIFQPNIPFSMELSGAIKGWQEVVPLLKEGGEMRVMLPSAMGYGLQGQTDSQGSVSIPPVACLDFEIKITEVKR